MPFGRTVSGGTIFFTANNGTDGTELWKSNGTVAGTVLIKDIFPGPTGGMGTIFPDVNVDSTHYFAASDGVSGSELWKSDGTAAGTVPVADINLGPAGSNPGSFITIGTTLFFTANDGTGLGPQLWSLVTPPPPTPTPTASPTMSIPTRAPLRFHSTTGPAPPGRSSTGTGST